MRILIATDAFPPKIDGVADTAATIAGRLAARGHTVRVIAPAPGPTEAPGYRIARVGSVPFPLYPEVRVSLALDRVRRLARHHWDGAIVLTPGTIGATVMASLPRSIPVLNVYTTDIPAYLRAYSIDGAASVAERLMLWMARRSVRTLCPTLFVHDELAARGFPKLEIWGRGVDTDIFRPERRTVAMRERLTSGHPEAPLVVFVGRLAREKALSVLHDAARQLPPETHYAFIGDGPERNQLESRFAGLNAVFTGYLRGAQLASAYASADVFAFPSATETFGQVVVQSMACGVPPVVAAGTATAELVPPGVAGLHFAPGQPGAFARQIERLIEDPGLRNSMSAAAVEHAQRFSWDALVSRLEVLLDPTRENTYSADGAEEAAQLAG